MAKFIMVTSLPETLEKGMMVIENPTFQEEINTCRVRNGNNKLTTTNHLRALFDHITFNYDQTVNPLHINVSNYIGRAFNNDQELSKILVEIVNKEKPQLVDKYIEKRLLGRDKDVSTVYTTVSTHRAPIFIKCGLDQATKEELKDAKESLKKTKKTDENVV